MFVKNLSKCDITLRDKGKVIKIKAGKVATIDELFMTKERIKALYGKNIVILGEIKEEPKKEERIEINDEQQKEIKEAIEDILSSLTQETEITTDEEKSEEVAKNLVEVITQVDEDKNIDLVTNEEKTSEVNTNEEKTSETEITTNEEKSEEVDSEIIESPAKQQPKKRGRRKKS